MNPAKFLERKLTAWLANDYKPLFVVGCGHSGTSLLLAILGSHSHIYPVPFESKLGYKFFKKFFYLWKFRANAKRNHKSRWAEKTPRHIYRIDALLEIAPGAKVLLIIRDGRDVACSFRDRFGDIETGIKTWVQDNTIARIYREHPGVMIVRYEDLVADFENTLKQMLNFIGEDFEPAMLEFHKQPKYFYSSRIEKPGSVTGKDHDQYRNWQINQPLFDGRGKWQQNLAPEEKEVIKRAANDMLIEFGYADNANW